MQIIHNIHLRRWLLSGLAICSPVPVTYVATIGTDFFRNVLFSGKYSKGILPADERSSCISLSQKDDGWWYGNY
ncbi:UNVERIFIED_ORG: hypothetical protein FHU00_5140 [Citrobacter freundii]